MESVDWGWIWLGAFVFFLVGELITPGAFFMLGFAIGAVVAMLAAIVGANEVVQWALFVAVSAAAFGALRPLAHRMDRRADPSPNVGSTRLPGSVGVLIAPVGPGPSDAGMAEVGSEQWRAVTEGGSILPAGTHVAVVRVEGTRVVVQPAPAAATPTGPLQVPPPHSAN